MREWSESPLTNIILAFESCDWTDEDLPAYYVMNNMIGSATSFSAGGPGKGMYCRAITHMMQRYNFVEGVSAVSSHFTDSGIFGINIQGPSSHSADLMYVVVEELNKLKLRITDEELSRCKNILKMNILMAMERKEDRLEEIARNYMTFKDLSFSQYCNKIDLVTTQDINRVAEKMLSKKPTLLVTGGAINLVPNITEVGRQLQ
mmetsp:Transcript_36212/g.35150  ORF Transcript_36212/g.35150 Transcript_36212/m.35150 type:complete len:204 (-) Transcript_36212:17-628(-)